MIGNTSTIGLNATYASGNRANNKLSISKTSICNVKHIKSNIINSTIKIGKSLIYLQYIFLIIKNFHIQLILIIFSTFFVLLSKIK